MGDPSPKSHEYVIPKAGGGVTVVNWNLPSQGDPIGVYEKFTGAGEGLMVIFKVAFLEHPVTGLVSVTVTLPGPAAPQFTEI